LSSHFAKNRKMGPALKLLYGPNLQFFACRNREPLNYLTQIAPIGR